MGAVATPGDDMIVPDSDPELRTQYLRLKGALWDPNTKLAGLAAVLETVRAFFQKTTSVGVIHVEIDPMARVETTYGWQYVDRIFQAVAEELRGIRVEILPAGTVLCQTGICADQFLLFAPLGKGESATRTSALGRASQAFRDRMARRFGGPEFQSMAPRPGFSVGVAVVTEHPVYRLERQIYRVVDEARQAGRMAEPREQERQQAELKRIIRDQSIETFFQPVLELEHSRIVGYEALTRGPRDSFFESPATLFEYSREMGMSAELDLICQRAALKQARCFQAGDKLFLNALPLSLLDPGFREGLLADLPEDFPVARGDIVLEIAQGGAWEDHDGFGSEVSDLRARGFQMSIDDVGKAPSSLERLNEVRPDYIKVDTSLIRNIHQSAIKQDVLTSICNAAEKMGARIIAEGIETQEECDTVMSCGVKYGQGFLFYRPSRELPRRGARAGHYGA